MTLKILTSSTISTTQVALACMARSVQGYSRKPRSRQSVSRHVIVLWSRGNPRLPGRTDTKPGLSPYSLQAARRGQRHLPRQPNIGHSAPEPGEQSPHSTASTLPPTMLSVILSRRTHCQPLLPEFMARVQANKAQAGGSTGVVHVHGGLKQPEGQQHSAHADQALAQQARGRQPVGALPLLQRRLRLLPPTPTILRTL